MFDFLVLCTFAVAQPPMMQPPSPPPFYLPLAPRPRVKIKIPSEVEQAVRKAISADGIGIGSIRIEGIPIDAVAIPKELRDAYAAHPSALIELLLLIAEEADPVDSMKAVAYALSLIDSPVHGVVFVRVFDKVKDNYDKVNPFGGVTPREHWISGVKEELQRKK